MKKLNSQALPFLGPGVQLNIFYVARARATQSGKSPKVISGHQ